MNGKRTDWSRLVMLGIALALAAVAVWAILRRREDPWTDDDTDAESPQVAVPVVRTRDADPVVVPVATDAQAVPVPVAAASTSAGEPPFGPGSAAPDPDGGGPSGWTIKAKDGSRLYHTAASPSWERMHADAWFESEEAAEAAGFKRWDWRRRTGPDAVADRAEVEPAT